MTKRRITMLVAATMSLALVASACGDDATTSNAADDTVDDVVESAQSDDTDAGADTEPSTDTAQTSDADTEVAQDVADTDDGETAVEIDADPSLLLNCAGTIDDDVPAFYANYFRCVDISMDGDVVVIASANQPPHLSWYYDEANDLYTQFESRGDGYFQNPNTIAQTSFTLRIPVSPTEIGVTIDDSTVNLATGDSTDYPFGVAGVALDSASYFNPLAAPGDDIEDEKFSFDLNEGHPQQQGTYHYHAPALGPLTVLQSLGLITSNIPGAAEIELYGIMCDGTVLFGQTELDGSTPSDDLDLQAGHTHDIVDADGAVLIEDRYHVHMAPTIGAVPRGLTPEAQYYSTCDIG